MERLSAANVTSQIKDLRVGAGLVLSTDLLRRLREQIIGYLPSLILDLNATDPNRQTTGDLGLATR